MFIESVSPHVCGDFTALLEDRRVPVTFYPEQYSDEPTIEFPNRPPIVRFDEWDVDRVDEMIVLLQEI